MRQNETGSPELSEARNPDPHRRSAWRLFMCSPSLLGHSSMPLALNTKAAVHPLHTRPEPSNPRLACHLPQVPHRVSQAVLALNSCAAPPPPPPETSRWGIPSPLISFSVIIP